MRKRSMNVWGTGLAVGAALVAIGQPSVAEASSHREAPFITKSPKVDNTDVYFFRSWEDPTMAVMLANYQPLQDAYGGPNYFTMDPEALYEQHFDTTGDGVEDLTFQWRFKNTLSGGNGVTLPIGGQDVAIPFVNANVVTPAGGTRPFLTFDNQNMYRNALETYTVNIVRGPRRTGEVKALTSDAGGDFVKPLDYVGTKSFGPAPAYKTYSEAHITGATIPPGTGECAAGGHVRVFAGQRQEGFAVLLGNIFDLVNATAAQLTAANGGAIPNPIGNKNVTTLALEIPIACLASDPTKPVGAWATASVRQARAINPQATFGTPSKEGGAWAQVSRLGSPLVNEVVIGLKDKDKFNSSEPKDDGANFATYVTNPTLPAVLEALFGPTVKAPTVFPRVDLVEAFAQGVPGVNAANATTVAEMLRLNLSLPATAPDKQVYLGAAGCFKPNADPNMPKVLDTTLASCDPAGFPNGRRPGDDVVDIALRVMVGYLLGNSGGTAAPSADLELGDSVPVRATDFMATFPFLNTPNAGATGG